VLEPLASRAVLATETSSGLVPAQADRTAAGASVVPAVVAVAPTVQSQPPVHVRGPDWVHDSNNSDGQTRPIPGNEPEFSPHTQEVRPAGQPAGQPAALEQRQGSPGALGQKAAS